MFGKVKRIDWKKLCALNESRKYELVKVVMEQIPKEKLDFDYLMSELKKNKENVTYANFLQKLVAYCDFSLVRNEKLIVLLKYPFLNEAILRTLKWKNLSFKNYFEILEVKMVDVTEHHYTFGFADAFKSREKFVIENVSKVISQNDVEKLSQIEQLINFDNVQVSQFGFELLKSRHTGPNKQNEFLVELHFLLVNKRINTSFINCFEKDFEDMELYQLMQLLELNDEKINDYASKAIESKYGDEFTLEYCQKAIVNASDNVCRFVLKFLPKLNLENHILNQMVNSINPYLKEFALKEFVQKHNLYSEELYNCIRKGAKGYSLDNFNYENSFSYIPDDIKEILKAQHPEFYYKKEEKTVAAILKQIGC